MPTGMAKVHGSDRARSVRKGETPVSIEQNIQTAKDLFAAIGQDEVLRL